MPLKRCATQKAQFIFHYNFYALHIKFHFSFDIYIPPFFASLFVPLNPKQYHNMKIIKIPNRSEKEKRRKVSVSERRRSTKGYTIPWKLWR